MPERHTYISVGQRPTNSNITSNIEEEVIYRFLIIIEL